MVCGVRCRRYLQAHHSILHSVSESLCDCSCVRLVWPPLSPPLPLRCPSYFSFSRSPPLAGACRAAKPSAGPKAYTLSLPHCWAGRVRISPGPGFGLASSCFIKARVLGRQTINHFSPLHPTPIDNTHDHRLAAPNVPQILKVLPSGDTTASEHLCHAAVRGWAPSLCCRARIFQSPANPAGFYEDLGQVNVGVRRKRH